MGSLLGGSSGFGSGGSPGLGSVGTGPTAAGTNPASNPLISPSIGTPFWQQQAQQNPQQINNAFSPAAMNQMSFLYPGLGAGGGGGGGGATPPAGNPVTGQGIPQHPSAPGSFSPSLNGSVLLPPGMVSSGAAPPPPTNVVTGTPLQAKPPLGQRAV
jgi:hypothetical protein